MGKFKLSHRLVLVFVHPVSVLYASDSVISEETIRSSLSPGNSHFPDMFRQDLLGFCKAETDGGAGAYDEMQGVEWNSEAGARRDRPPAAFSSPVSDTTPFTRINPEIDGAL
ncbi:hypothetical protein V6N12_052169 [Hibiscus sabdariffa]